MDKALLKAQIDMKSRFDKTKASRSPSSKMPLSLKKQQTIKPSTEFHAYSVYHIGCFFQDYSAIFSEGRRKFEKGGHALSKIYQMATSQKVGSLSSVHLLL